MARMRLNYIDFLGGLRKLTANIPIYTPVLFGKRYFALELTDWEVRLLRVSSLKKGFTLEGLAVQNRPDEKGLRDFLVANGLRGGRARNVARVGIYPKSAYFLLNNLGANEVSKNLQTVTASVHRQLMLEDVPYMRRVLSPASGKGYDSSSNESEWLFSGAKAEACEDFIARFEAAGVTVERQELGLLSTIGIVKNLIQLEQIIDNVLVMVLGSDSSWAFVVNKDKLSAIRNLTITIKSFVADYQKSAVTNDESQASSALASLDNSVSKPAEELAERIQRELEAFCGYYELHTGKSIGSICVLPGIVSLDWIGPHVASAIGKESFKPNYAKWLEAQGASWSAGLSIESLGPSWLPLISLVSTL